MSCFETCCESFLSLWFHPGWVFRLWVRTATWFDLKAITCFYCIYQYGELIAQCGLGMGTPQLSRFSKYLPQRSITAHGMDWNGKYWICQSNLIVCCYEPSVLYMPGIATEGLMYLAFMHICGVCSITDMCIVSHFLISFPGFVEIWQAFPPANCFWCWVWNSGTSCYSNLLFLATYGLLNVTRCFSYIL